jgi:hypothetical protein
MSPSSIPHITPLSVRCINCVGSLNSVVKVLSELAHNIFSHIYKYRREKSVKHENRNYRMMMERMAFAFHSSKKLRGVNRQKKLETCESYQTTDERPRAVYECLVDVNLHSQLMVC